jgi:eukaryotic-like serine/threonine-protein kinase
MSFTRLFSRPFFVASLLWLILLTVAYVAVDYWVMPTFAGQFKHKATVPAVIGLKTDSAEAMLDRLKLEFMLDSTSDYSVKIPAGHILSQFPAAGTVVKEGRRVWVKVSKGFKAVDIPQLRGLSVRQAEITLQQAGLKVGRVAEVLHAAIPAGAIIGTVPPAGAKVEMGRKVDIQVSSGVRAAVTVMPALRGRSLNQAKEQLRDLGLTLGKVSSRKESRSLPNTVLEQNPAAGKPLNGQAVDLILSK